MTATPHYVARWCCGCSSLGSMRKISTRSTHAPPCRGPRSRGRCPSGHVPRPSPAFRPGLQKPGPKTRLSWRGKTGHAETRHAAKSRGWYSLTQHHFNATLLISAVGAGDRIRTCTGRSPETCRVSASTNSATPTPRTVDGHWPTTTRPTHIPPCRGPTIAHGVSIAGIV